VIRQAQAGQATLAISAPASGQQAVAAALDSDYYPALAAQRAALIARRAALQARLATIPRRAWPATAGAVFAFVRVVDGPPVERLAPDLIRQAGVLLLPGTIFGAAGACHLRLAYGTTPVPVLETALARLRAYFA